MLVYPINHVNHINSLQQQKLTNKDKNNVTFKARDMGFNKRLSKALEEVLKYEAHMKKVSINSKEYYLYPAAELDKYISKYTTPLPQNKFPVNVVVPLSEELINSITTHHIPGIGFQRDVSPYGEMNARREVDFSYYGSVSCIKDYALNSEGIKRIVGDNFGKLEGVSRSIFYYNEQFDGMDISINAGDNPYFMTHKYYFDSKGKLYKIETTGEVDQKTYLIPGTSDIDYIDYCRQVMEPFIHRKDYYNNDEIVCQKYSSFGERIFLERTGSNIL